MKKNSHIIPFTLLFLLIIIMAGATVAEKLFGSDFALLNIYNSWWFVVLWGLLAVFSVNSIFLKNGISKNRILKNKISILLIHIAFLVILAGALVTFLTAKRGSMHIRQGEIHNYYIDEKTQTRQPLPFDLKLLLFEIEYHENSDKPSNFHSYLMINNEVCEVAMNKIHSQNHYRLYQMEYDNDEMGSTLLVNYDFWGISITYFGYLLLLISALWLLWQKRITIKRNTFLKRVTFGGSILPIVAVPTALVWIFISQIKPMTPILRSPMLAAHVSVIMVSYFLLLLIAVLSIIALLQKNKEQVQKLYALNSTLLYPALFLLAIGIFLGAVWANISWGRYWGWDSKETWALITLLIYAVPMHKGSFKAFTRPKFFHTYCILAFLTVLMTFLGVNFILGGLHSYL